MGWLGRGAVRHFVPSRLSGVFTPAAPLSVPRSLVLNGLEPRDAAEAAAWAAVTCGSLAR